MSNRSFKWYHRTRSQSCFPDSSRSYHVRLYNKAQAMAAANSPLPIMGPIELAPPVLGVELGDPLGEVELPVLLLLTLATATPLTPVAFLH